MTVRLAYSRGNIIKDLSMRLFFLDDNPTRHEVLKATGIQADHCYTYDDALVKLQPVKYDVLSLDHDLGEGDDYCTPGVNNKHKTGTDLARVIVERDIIADVIILHSFNPIGAQSMHQILMHSARQVLRMPFGFDTKIYTTLQASRNN